MRSVVASILASAVLVLAGCGSLAPKNVEFFQSKVKEFPDPSDKFIEVQKQAIWKAKQSADTTVDRAIRSGAQTNVIASARDTRTLTEAVAVAVGPPEAQSSKTPEALASDVLSRRGAWDSDVRDFQQRNDSLAGKKIEGTGLFQVPYFLYIGGIVTVLGIIWMVLKAVLTAASVANPAASVGLGVMNVGGSLAGKAITQLIRGGEKFKEWVKAEVNDPQTQQKILEAFRSVHERAQDHEVQSVVKGLT